MSKPAMIYVPKYRMFIRADWWREAWEKSRRSPAKVPIRDAEEVKRFEIDLKKRPVITR